MDQWLNLAFFVVHTAWTLFTCVGWIWKRTRVMQLVAALLTALSWLGLGAWYGWGYCPFTDWHWQVRARLGYHDPPSYVRVADALAVGVLAGALGLSVWLTVRDRLVRAATRSVG
jgi:hypothetical protein